MAEPDITKNLKNQSSVFFFKMNFSGWRRPGLSHAWNLWPENVTLPHGYVVGVSAGDDEEVPDRVAVEPDVKDPWLEPLRKLVDEELSSDDVKDTHQQHIPNQFVKGEAISIRMTIQSTKTS